MSGAVGFIPPRFFMSCNQFNLYFYEVGTVCLRDLIRVEFKDKLLRELQGGVPMFKLHATKTCMGIELRHSFRAGFQRFRIIYQPHQTSGTRIVTRGTFHAEDPQALGAVVQNIVARAIGRAKYSPQGDRSCKI